MPPPFLYVMVYVAATHELPDLVYPGLHVKFIVQVGCVALQVCVTWFIVPDAVSVPYVQSAFAGHVGFLQFTIQDLVHCVSAVEPAGDVYPESHPVHALPFL